MSSVEPGRLERALIEKATPKKVLLIDDSREDKEAIEALTREYNIDWSWARNYDEAVAVLAKYGSGYFKLIFLDLRLGTYEECFRVFRHIDKADSAPVMVLSGALDTRVISQLLSIGFAGFCEKPANFNQKFFAKLFALVDIKLKPAE